MTDAPTPRRIVLCRGEFCNLGRRADRLYRDLEAMVADLNAQADAPYITLTTATCLSMCGVAPNCIVFPGGHAFHQLTPEKLRTIVDDHLRP